MIARILVIEDDPDDEAVLCSLLEQSKRPVTVVCEDCSPGTPAFDAGVFQLVFLDMSLPDSWGLETLRRFRTFPDVPVVLMTGAVLPGWRQRRLPSALACIFKHQLDGQKLQNSGSFLRRHVKMGQKERMETISSLDFLTRHWGGGPAREIRYTSVGA